METKNTQNKQSDFEFNLVEILQVISKRKRVLYSVAAIFLVLGIFVSLISPKEYSASTSFVSQISSEKKLGKKISGIAALVGVSLGGSGESVILPTQYPLILESTPFKRQLLDSKIPVAQRDSLVTVGTYLSEIRKKPTLTYIKEYTIGLPGKAIGLFRSDPETNVRHSKIIDSTIYKITQQEKVLLEYLYSNISLQINDVDGYIQISTTFPQAEAAAQLANNIQNLLQKFIIEFNIMKTSQELDYIEKRYAEAEQDYFNKRAALARFKDQNINMISNLAQNRLEQLQTEYSLSSNIYSQLAGELESAKLNVKKDTPVFTVLKPATVPLEPSAPNKMLIIIGFVVVGILLACFLILAKYYYPIVRSKLQS